MPQNIPGKATAKQIKYAWELIKASGREDIAYTSLGMLSTEAASALIADLKATR